MESQARTTGADAEALDVVDHVAVPVQDVSEAVSWYVREFRCEIIYQDKTWAFLRFRNTNLALVVPGQHPPHVAFLRPDAERFGPLTTHQDGTRSCYAKDPCGNAVEVMASAT